MVQAWLGLRYAQPQARFTPAKPATGQLGVATLREVPIFPQLPSRLAAAMGQGARPAQSEDAFFLNLWAPTQARGLPVLLFIHGGAWMTGGGSMPWYDGTRLAAQGMVVVNVNYRIGAFGHLGSSDADGLPIPATDLLLALQWVLDHAATFGGDPQKITLIGQSSGGWYAHLLSVLPQTQGMIHRVALLSMGTRTPWTPAQQTHVTQAANLQLEGRLAIAPAAEVLKAAMTALPKVSVQLGHAPSGFLPVASAGLPPSLLDPAWAAAQVHVDAVYLRCTQDESATMLFNVHEQRQATQAQVDAALSQWTLADLPQQLLKDKALLGSDSGLSPYRQLLAASSWRQFQRFPTEYATHLQAIGKQVQYSYFTTESLLPDLHSGHCFDLPFQFGVLKSWCDAPMLAGLPTDQFEVISRILRTEIQKFAGA